MFPLHSQGQIIVIMQISTDIYISIYIFFLLHKIKIVTIVHVSF